MAIHLYFQEECYFDCVVTSCASDGATGSSPIVLDPSCLQDCFSNEPEKSCLDPLLTHVQENSPCSPATQTMLLSDIGLSINIICLIVVISFSPPSATQYC